MRREVFDCDVCGKLAQPRATLAFVTGCQSDAAGGPSRLTGPQIDFCVACCQKALTAAYEQMNRQCQGQFLANIQNLARSHGRTIPDV